MSNINRIIINESILYDTSDDLLRKSEKLLNDMTTDYEYQMNIKQFSMNVIDQYFMTELHNTLR